MRPELRERIIAFNRERVAEQVEKLDLEKRVNLLLADRAILNAENTRLAEDVASATERMKAIANGFSNSLWAILPSKIKEYFAEYRD